MSAAYRFARVRAAFFAAAERSAALLTRATERACFESACFDAAAPLSRLSALSVACERFRDVWRAAFPRFFEVAFRFFARLF